MTLKANVISGELTTRTSSAILGVGNKTPECINPNKELGIQFVEEHLGV